METIESGLPDQETPKMDKFNPYTERYGQSYEVGEKDKLIYELYWYLFEVLLGHFGEGQFNRKHI